MHQMLLGFAEVLSPTVALWCLLGTVLGIVVGAIPGLTGAMLIALTLPLTYYMDPVPSVVLLIGMYVGSISGGLITATLLRMPGTPSNIMTTFDGYPMARAGKPGRALGLGITASFVGGLLSWVVLVLLAKPLSVWATRFGPFEIFSLILMAMVLIASVSQGSLLKGLISGVLGMLLSMPGVDPSAGQPRLTFGVTDLNGGLKLLPVLIGVFAVSQIISDILGMDERVDSIQASRSGMLLKLEDWRRHGANMLRSSAIGTFVGILPGIGASIGSVMAYTAAKNVSKTPERFGQGAEEGIVASEAANNATIGGALVPLIAMGIPGSVIDAVLIGGLMIHDIQPGPTLFMVHSDVVWAMIAACFVANLMMFVVMSLSVGLVARIASLPKMRLLPVVMVFCIIGVVRPRQHLFRRLGDARLRTARLCARTCEISPRAVRDRLRARTADGAEPALRTHDERRITGAARRAAGFAGLLPLRDRAAILAADLGLAQTACGKDERKRRRRCRRDKGRADMTAAFQGYRRADGRVGVRNLVLVLSVNGLTGPAARRIARSVAGTACVGLPYGSGLIGEDEAATRRALVGFASHPNVGGALIVGADPPWVEEIAAAAEEKGQRIVALTLDGCGHDALRLAERGVREAARLLREASRAQRGPATFADLCLGLECGRSDPSSGLVANPLLGRIADRIADAGGSSMIGESTEWLGAEHLLANRASRPEVAEAIVAAARRREAMAVAAGIDLTGHNPSATNIAGGLSTIEEKSLGAVAKSGSAPIAGLLAYGEAPAAGGTWVMDAPAYAPESLGGFVAAGANLILFTTGLGNSYGSSLAPTLKVTANPETAAQLDSQIDFDASAVFRGEETLADAQSRLEALIGEAASGMLTWSETLLETDEVISRFGPAL